MSPAERLEPAVGDVLGAKFRVERVVGRGGMGVVLEATNLQLDQRVALKLLVRGADDPATSERFLREARAAVRLKSQHVARVFDVGRDPVFGPFIVMELLAGQTLAELVEAGGRLPVHRAVEYVIDACECLAEAHARGIVHQDIKPANLFLVDGDDGRPMVKVLDFGIATMRSGDAASDARASSSRSHGTPAYLSPEQLRGTATIDHRADLWALGCVLYELVAGERPFRATHFTGLVTKILESPPDPFSSPVEMPPGFPEILDRCLEKDRDRRFQTTGELALALLPFARRRAHSSVAKAVAHVKAGGLDAGLQMPSSMPPPPTSEQRVRTASIPGLRAPGVPSFDAAPASTGAPPVAASGAATAPAPRSRLMLGVLAFLGVLGVLGFGVWLGRGRATGPGVGAPVASAPVAAAPSVTGGGDVAAAASGPPSSTAPSSAAPSSAAPSSTPAASTVATAAPSPRPGPTAAPPLPRRPSSPSVSPVVPAATGESEIRHTR